MVHALRTLKNRDFRLFLGGQLISLVGTWMQLVAQSWLVYRLTGSSLLLGSTAFCGQIPILLFSPLGGIVADRFSRRRVVLACQTASMLLAAVLAGLTLAGQVKVGHIFVLAACLGIVNAFDIPAAAASSTGGTGPHQRHGELRVQRFASSACRAGVLRGREGWCFLATRSAMSRSSWGSMMSTRKAPGAATSPWRHQGGLRFVQDPSRALLVLLDHGLWACPRRAQPICGQHPPRRRGRDGRLRPHPASARWSRPVLAGRPTQGWVPSWEALCSAPAWCSLPRDLLASPPS